MFDEFLNIVLAGVWILSFDFLFDFNRRARVFVFHHLLCRCDSRFICLASDSNQNWQGSLHLLPSVSNVSTGRYGFAVKFYELFYVSNLRNAQFLCQLWSHLRGIAVNRLSAAENDIVIDFLNGTA